ncbi:ZrgA family zinc uptake protein [Ningiella sp. W23]|uniref:ZrgA family zinc uptake protein n=1 Tax=Ningiella sp. W23 TaxID=3023715 RepID=UPI0037573AA0
MSKSISHIASLSALSLLVCHSASAQKHVHGEGQLLIAQQQQDWQFEFVLPAADMLGFEHAPETEQQKETLNLVVEKVEGVRDIIQLPESCQLTSMSHSLDDFKPGEQISTSNHSHSKEHEHAHDDEHKHGDSHDHDHNHGEHAHMDIIITYQFSCEVSPEQMEVTLLSWADTLSKLNTQWIINDGQGASVLQPSSNLVNFNQ